MSSGAGGRLWMVVHAHYPVGEPRVERAARAARDAGYRVAVLALGGSDEKRRETIEGIEVHRLPLVHRRGVNLLQLAWEYAQFAMRSAGYLLRQSALDPIDVVHVHTPPDFLVFAALPVRLRGAALILDIHDLSPDMFVARFTGRRRVAALVVRLLTAIELIAARLADHVITVHDPYRDELIRHGVARHRIAVVMNAVDPDLLDSVRLGDRHDASAEFCVAYHGTITKWYGVDLVVDALAQLRDQGLAVRGVVLGEGDALPDVVDRAMGLRIDDKIEFSRKYLPLGETLRRVASASCGVVPNRPTRLNRFALSSKLFEYVALGIPVVCARLETIQAHFGPDEVTFFEPADAQSLAECLRWVATHEQEASRKAQRARSRARAYSWQASRGRYLDVLADVAR